MRVIVSLAALAASFFLFSCEHQIAQETRIGEDGALTKTIVLDMSKPDNKVDSADWYKNYFGAAEQRGWKLEVESFQDEDDEERYRIRFEKEFASVDALNAELDTGVDTLFNVNASFENQFWWLFTYIRYEETFRSLNRFRFASAEEFFSEKDFEFINRLPPEGEKLSVDDSIYLERLNKMVTEQYATEAMFKELMDILKRLISMSSMESRWLDTLAKHEQRLYKSLMESSGGADYLVLELVDSLGIPLPGGAKPVYDSLYARFKSRVDFMSYAWDSRYSVMFEMPYDVVTTNADSVAGNLAFWRPMPHKFAFSDYTFYAEARKPSILGIAMTAVMVLGTFVFLRRKRKEA